MDPRRPSLGAAWLTPSLLCAVAGLAPALTALLYLGLSPWAREQQWANGSVAEWAQRLLAASLVGHAGAQLVLAGLAERFGGRRSLHRAWLFSAAVCTGTAFLVEDPLALLGSAALLGLAQALLTPMSASLAYTGSRWHRHRATPWALWGATPFLVWGLALLGLVQFSELLTPPAWAGAVLLAGLGAPAAASWALVALRPADALGARAATPRGRLLQGRGRGAGFTAYVLASVLAWALTWAWLVWVPCLVLDSPAGSIGSAASVAASACVALVAGTLVFAALGDRTRRWALLAAFGLLTCSAGLIVAARTASVPMLAWVYGFSAFALGGFHGQELYTISRLARGIRVGRAVGTCRALALPLGAMLSLLLLPALHFAHGDLAPALILLAALASAAAVLLCVISVVLREGRD